jgi:tRNA (adenine-N(1)-)-methyltransferase non-catalytic subunit
MIIKESDSCIIKMPSGNYKIVHLLPNQRVDLGKFGSFPTNNLFGNHFGIPLEIVGDDLIRVQQSDFLACFDIDIKKDNGQTNDQITQNKQNLSQEEIEELKKQNVNHLVIIENLAKNNVNYNEKTEYAKAKYINRKLKKYWIINSIDSQKCLSLLE